MEELEDEFEFLPAMTATPTLTKAEKLAQLRRKAPFHRVILKTNNVTVPSWKMEGHVYSKSFRMFRAEGTPGGYLYEPFSKDYYYIETCQILRLAAAHEELQQTPRPKLKSKPMNMTPGDRLLCYKILYLNEQQEKETKKKLFASIRNGYVLRHDNTYTCQYHDRKILSWRRFEIEQIFRKPQGYWVYSKHLRVMLELKEKYASMKSAYHCHRLPKYLKLNIENGFMVPCREQKTPRPWLHRICCYDRVCHCTALNPGQSFKTWVFNSNDTPHDLRLDITRREQWRRQFTRRALPADLQEEIKQGLRNMRRPLTCQYDYCACALSDSLWTMKKGYWKRFTREDKGEIAEPRAVAYRRLNLWKKTKIDNLLDEIEKFDRKKLKQVHCMRTYPNKPMRHFREIGLASSFYEDYKRQALLKLDLVELNVF